MSQKLIIFILFCGVIHFSSGSAYSDCGSVEGAFTEIEVNDCKTTDKVCILRKNTNASIAITFTSKKPSAKVTAVVHGKVFGAEVPFPLPNPDGCFKSGLLCPIAEGGPYKYETTLPVLKEYPAIAVGVKWQLKNDDDEDIVCALIQARIK